MQCEPYRSLYHHIPLCQFLLGIRECTGRGILPTMRLTRGGSAVNLVVLFDRSQDEPHKLRHRVTLDPPRNDDQVVDRVYVYHVDA